MLPSIGDPFLLNIWFKLSYPNFKDEIDHVYVVLDCNHVLSDTRGEIIQAKKYIYDKYNALSGVSVVYSKAPGLGGTLTEIFDICKHPLFGIIQEDAYVYRPGEVDRVFKLIEDDIFDVVGTPMYCYSGVLNEFMDTLTGGKEKWLNHLGYAFWQNFFFTSMSTIRQTDMRVNLQTWFKEQYIPFMKTKMPSDVSLDIMASVSFQLRLLKKRIKYVSQTLSLNDDCWYPLDVNYWQHVNSLSGIFSFIEKTDWDETRTDTFKYEMERRVAWWQFALTIFPTEDIENVKELYIKYGGTLQKIIAKYHLNLANIDKRFLIIKGLFNI